MTKTSLANCEYLEGDDLEGILPCPWCGEYSVEKENYLAKVTDKQGWKSIRCGGCGCDPTFYVHSWEEVIRLWNSRVTFSDSSEFQLGMEAYKRYILDVIEDRGV